MAAHSSQPKTANSKRTSSGTREALVRINQAKRAGDNDPLNLTNLGLTKLPKAVWQLTATRHLFLGENRLTTLPDELGQLTALEDLRLISNQLTTLPDTTRRLQALRVLSLPYNRLKEVPEVVFELTGLQELDLAGNPLSALPEMVGNLKALQELELSRTGLRELPETLRALPDLKRIFLHGNPALGIPDDALGPTWVEWVEQKATPKPAKEILEYYFRTLRLKKRPLNEAKLILVGRGGVGKTSLRKRLLSGGWDEHEDKTPGIQVTRWPLTVDGDEVTLNVWDFGGQEIMHATHQFFLTKRSLYLLVLNAREGKQDANVENWLRLIGAYGDSAPTLVVVNKCEQHSLDLTEQTLRQKFPFIRGFIRTDCRTNVGIDDLRAAIARETTALPDLRAPFPAAWFSLKGKLEALPSDCITYDAYRALCDANDETDDSNQQVLIGFLHDLGTVLHFRDEPRLNDLGVLKPAWVTDGIYGLLNAEELAQSGGVLVMDRLGALLDPNKYPRERHDYLMQLMAKFELCFELPHTRGAKFLIPELLPEEPDELPNWGTDVLGFEYSYNVLPEGLLPRFIVRSHALSEVGPRWRSGVVLRYGNAEALVRADVQERRVTISIRGPGRQPRELLAVVRSHFDEIHGGISGLAAEEKVPVPGYPQVKLDYRKLLVREANEKPTVEFETETESIELPLGKLLDNFEEPEARRVRAANIINVYERGKLIMSSEHHDYRGATITNSVVGAHMQNITNAIQQQAPSEQRALLEKLSGEVGALISKLPADKQEEASGDFEQLVKGATAATPNRRWYSVSAEGLLEASKFTKDLAGNVAGTIGQLGKLIWPDFSLPSAGEEKK